MWNVCPNYWLNRKLSSTFTGKQSWEPEEKWGILSDWPVVPNNSKTTGLNVSKVWFLIEFDNRNTIFAWFRVDKPSIVRLFDRRNSSPVKGSNPFTRRRVIQTVIEMKIKNSLRALKGRHRDNRMVRRKGRIYIINKTNPRFKARQGWLFDIWFKKAPLWGLFYFGLYLPIAPIPSSL